MIPMPPVDLDPTGIILPLSTRMQENPVLLKGTA
jgi:hypothetical protein